MNALIPTQKVLVVDDAADNRQILNDLLKADYTVLLAKSGEQGLERAVKFRPDLILLDVMMPGMSGYEVMAKLQQDPAVSDIAVIFITGLDSPDDVAKGLMHGAADYICKPFIGEVVKARVAAQMRLARQQQVVRDAQTRVDAPTGLPNRLGFDAALLDELERSEREVLALGLLVMEVGVSDAEPRATANALTTCLTKDALGLFRVAPQRFATLLPGVDEAESAQLAARLRGEAALASLDLRVGHASTQPGAAPASPLYEQASGRLI